MSQLAQDVFASARAAGLLAPGFVGTFADVKEALNALGADEDYYDPDEDGSKAWARWAEGGWHGGRLTDEEAEDRARNPFDPQAGHVNCYCDQCDPDGEGWNAHCEQEGERWAEGRASAWFNFPGDRH